MTRGRKVKRQENVRDKRSCWSEGELSVEKTGHEGGIEEDIRGPGDPEERVECTPGGPVPLQT